MKRKVFCLTALLAMCVSYAFAQVDDIPNTVKPKNHVFQLGVRAGGNLSMMSQPEECELFESSSFGYSGGAAMGLRFGRASENSSAGTGLWGVGLEVNYRNSSAKTYAIDENGVENAKLSLGYIDIPVSVQIFPCYKISAANTLYIEAGVSFAALLNRGPKSLTLNNLSGDYSGITYNINQEESKLKGGDIRPFAGVGYTIPKTGLGLNVRYYIGTCNLAENLTSKVSSVEFSLSYKFNVAKF